MKYLDDLVAFLIKNTEEKLKQDKEDKEAKGMSLGGFRFPKLAKDLVEPARLRAEHHRAREKHYVEELAVAEKELREKGVSVEVFDQATSTYMNQANIIASGNIQTHSAVFQPRIDQRLLDSVKNAKSKMLSHRSSAEQYEKYARAFACCPLGAKVDLGVEDVHYFKLES